MPRGARSPPPVGRDAGRSRDPRRDDRRRPRSRTPERRHRDRDRAHDRGHSRDSYKHNSHRSPDRRERDQRDDNRYSHRDRSRERHDRRRSPVKDRRHRDSDDSRPHSRRNDNTDGDRRKAPSRDGKSSRESTPLKKTEEELKAERQARLEAWKAKQQAKQTARPSTAGDKTPKTPTTPKEPFSPRTDDANMIDRVTSGVSTPKQDLEAEGAEVAEHDPSTYAGKFDPTSVIKKAGSQAKKKAMTLGDADVPVSQNHKPTTQDPKPTAPAPAAFKAKGNVTGFGLGAIKGDQTKPGSKRVVAFEDEEETVKRVKFEKLELLDDGADSAGDLTTHANGVEADDDDDDEDVAMDDEDEEDTAAATKAAAEKRFELEQQQNQDRVNDAKQTNDAKSLSGTEAPRDIEMATAENLAEEEDDDEDPLDAFMKTTLKSMPGPPAATTIRSDNVYFSDEDDDPEPVQGTGTDDTLARLQKAKSKKREMPPIDHSKIQYEQVEKDFLRSLPAELAELTEDDIADLRLEFDELKVRGKDIPPPVQNFAQLGLSTAMMQVIKDLGYEKPTPIQAQSSTALLKGKDVLGIAPTGSGKTIAFLLPMFRHIKVQRPLERGDGPQALIIAPTRELAVQIHNAARPFCKALNLLSVCVTGGQAIKDDIADMKRGNISLMVCTPGRLIEILTANHGRVTNLWSRCTYVVLDEADRMLDMGFEPQVAKILGQVRPASAGRQIALFSATFNRSMEALARKFLSNAVEITVGGRSTVNKDIKQLVEVFPGDFKQSEEKKMHRLLQLLGELHQDEAAQSLIFVDRHEYADNVLNMLMKRGYPCDSIHGGKSQEDRTQAIDDFRRGIIPSLVATSVAARGLDVPALKLVVNLDPPRFYEDYVHRAGRTGRAGRTDGMAVTFITDNEEQEKFAPDIVKALKLSDQAVPAELLTISDNFLEKVKSGKAKSAASGFGGRGLDRLDLDRAAERTREQKAYKTGDEPEEEESEEKKPAKAPEEQITVRAAGAPEPQPAGQANDMTDIASLIKVQKNEKATPAASNQKLKGAAGAAAAKEALERKLRLAGDIRGTAPIDNKGPDSGAFSGIVEINDFPQKARWNVTNRTNVAKILEATGVSITSKGSYFPPGREPGPDEAKLCLLVEGETELSVWNAMYELLRLRREGEIKAAESEARAPTTGRYSVV